MSKVSFTSRKCGTSASSTPGRSVEEGAEITVSVLRTKNLGDPKKERISLSIKALEEDPWDRVRKQFPQGNVVQGTVDAIEDYGAFVELAPNVRGMVHVFRTRRTPPSTTPVTSSPSATRSRSPCSRSIPDAAGCGSP